MEQGLCTSFQHFIFFIMSSRGQIGQNKMKYNYKLFLSRQTMKTIVMARELKKPQMLDSTVEELLELIVYLFIFSVITNLDKIGKKISD